MGQFPLDQPESREAGDWRSQPGMMGLRWALLRPDSRTGIDGTMDWLWPAAERAGLPVATMAGRFLPLFREIAERHPPETDHRPLRPAARLARTRRLRQSRRAAGAREAAQRRGQGDRRAGLFHAALSVQQLHDGLQRIFDAFGPERFFWGTDITRMPCSYRQCVTLFTEELPWLKGRTSSR